MADANLTAAPQVLPETPLAISAGPRRASDRQWNKLFFDLVTALAPTMLNSNPQGLCHLAADIADAAFAHRRVLRR